MTQRHDDIRNSLGFLLHDASRAIKRQFEGRAAELGLSMAQWRMLVKLVVDGPMPQARLAEALDIEPISASRLLDRMEEAGWAARGPAPDDRRVRLAEATPKAEAAFADARILAQTVYAHALEGFSAAEVETLRTALHRLIRNLSAPPLSPSPSDETRHAD